MEEFEDLINFEEKAIEEGREEAREYFFKEKLFKKGRHMGIYYGNELEYYRTIIRLLVPDSDVNKSQ